MAERMVKVRLLTGRVGNTFVQYAGEIIEVPARQGFALIAAGQAESVEPECAALEGAPQTAVLSRPKLRGGK